MKRKCLIWHIVIVYLAIILSINGMIILDFGGTNTTRAQTSTELYFDDGWGDFGWATGPEGGGVVLFSTPSLIWILSGIKVMAWYDLEDAPFYIEIWDSERNELFRDTYMYSDYFTSTQTWATIYLPNIVVVGDFYAGVFPNDSEKHRLWLSFDTDPPNSYKSFSAVYNTNTVEGVQDWNWMIRVLGYPGQDTTAPDTYINSGPSGTIDYNDVTFQYSGSDNIFSISSLVYSYKLEGYNSGWSPYTTDTSKNYYDLPDGHYTFIVKARDEADNIDLSPEERSFAVDVTPPTTYINSGPSGTINYNDVFFDYRGSDTLTAERKLAYSYKLEGPGHHTGWSSYTSATYWSYYGLSNGDYTFMVKTKDEADNEDLSPAQRTFTVDVTPPITYIIIGVISGLLALAVITLGFLWAKRQRARRRTSINGVNDSTNEGESGIRFVEKPGVSPDDIETAADVMCPVCRVGFTAQQKIRTCPECGVQHHKECWTMIGGCSTFGCKHAPRH